MYVCFNLFVYKSFSFPKGSHKDAEINQPVEEESLLISTQKGSATQALDNKTNLEGETEQFNAASCVQSVSSLGSTAISPFNRRRLRRSTASPCEVVVPVSAMELASSCGRLSSCSTVMITEEQLMLKPVKPEVGGKYMLRAVICLYII